MLQLVKILDETCTVDKSRTFLWSILDEVDEFSLFKNGLVQAMADEPDVNGWFGQRYSS